MFYRIKVSLNLRFTVSFIDLFRAIQYAVYRKSTCTFYVSLYIYMHIDIPP